MKTTSCRGPRFALLVVWLCATAAHAAGLSGCEDQVKYGAPSHQGVLLCRLGYAVSYDTSRKVPAWVAYHLTAEHMAGTHPRSNDFRPDPDLAEGERSELKDYKGSGYDRGHMAPAGSMKWSARAMSESFLLSNMAPQVGAGFNRGIWRKLEEDVRTWTEERGELYVVTGPIYQDGGIKTIGPDHVAVPTAFYKVIFDPVRVEAIAFILPNTSTPSSQLPNFIVSVDEVEAETGLDFLPKLNDNIEAVVEQSVAAVW